MANQRCHVATVAAVAAAAIALVAVPASVMSAATAANSAAATPADNEWVFLDMVQNNPGDPLGWQQTKYSDPATITALGYTGQVPTGEIAPTLAIDYSTAPQDPDGDYFPHGSPQRAWIDALGTAIDSSIARAHAAGAAFVPFVDMLVFPTHVVQALGPNITDGKGHIEWNNATAELLTVQLNETFARFPGIDGILIRCGETYVFDNPYHTGNSPVKTVQGQSAQEAVWVSFISFLRDLVCEVHGKKLYFRAWDSFAGWSGDPGYYLNVTNPVAPHPNLYFSIKHTAGDFFRYMPFNRQLAVGNHAQIIEVELQREYEGKGAFPNYELEGIINGYDDLGPSGKVGLQDIVDKPQIRGVWTWSRGGGWWGPYIHGHEDWVDIHVRVLATWWRSNGTMSEADAFKQYCVDVLDVGATSDACVAMREVALMSSWATLNGHYCGANGGQDPCWSWTRDNRLGGEGQLGGHFDNLVKWNALDESLALKQNATATFAKIADTFASRVAPALTDARQEHFMNTSIQYGAHYFGVIEAAWGVWTEGAKKDHNISGFNATLLEERIAVYDATWASYNALALARHDCPSQYRDVYFNEPGGAPSPGMGAWVDKYRANTTVAVGAPGTAHVRPSRGANVLTSL